MSAVELATAYISLVPTTVGIQSATATAMSGAAVGARTAGAQAGQQYGAAAAGGMSGALKGAVGLAAAAGVASLIGGAVEEAREAQKIGAVTAQVIRTTGGAAGVSADEVGRLSTAISNKTGVDDEAIQAGANMILTFKNVQNQAGEGADIFDRATQSAADLSAAGFGSMDSASRTLGKALDDPVAGIARLARVGVTFTDQQRDQVEALVASGDVLGAQQILLEGVEGKVGGVAAASATASEKMTVAWGNFKETIGTALLPVIDSVQGGLTGLFSFLSTNTPVLYGIIGVIGLLTAAMIANKVAAIASATAANAKAVAEAAAAGVTGIVTAAQWLWNIAMTANPIGLIIIAIAALIAIVVLLVANWDTVKEAGARAWEWIKDAWSGAGEWFGGIGEAIQGAFRSAFNGVAGAWNDTIGALSWTIPDWVPGIGGNTIAVPNIPMLASGGVVTRPTLAMVGEGREPEAVLPLSKLDAMLSGRPADVDPINYRRLARELARVRIDLDGLAVTRSVTAHIAAGGV